MPELRHFDNLNTARFVTFSRYHRRQLLTSDQVISAFLDTLNQFRSVHRFRLWAYAVSVRGRRTYRLWQSRCYDHNCRSMHTVVDKINSSHKNPVKRGLVSLPEEWRWSSYSWYLGERDIPIETDSMDI